MQKRFNTKDSTIIAVIGALYVILTFIIPVPQYGAIQFRLSEGLNHLAVFNKRYIVAVTIGVFIVNMFSPLGMIDMLFGTLGTFMMTTMSYYATRHIDSIALKLVLSTVINSAMMWVIALELHLFADTPFWMTYGWVAIGEFVSLMLGGVLIYGLSRRFDLTK
ncbi:QueT transporter family protein [Weissella ceti]|uniref:QueT transporter family protein n=1 Tax=Weissella ceti TaxID=759620 RepID=A0ABT3E3D5_9LACO|nr:QueT transporter family protein [Weissella ceti]MCW0952913.1 QueT transporter family protein [Weissella ceti]